MKSLYLDEGFREMLTGIPTPEGHSSINSYSVALIVLESSGPKEVPTEFLGDICEQVMGELLRRGVDITAGLIELPNKDSTS